MYKKTEGSFLSCDGISNIRYYIYTPETPPLALVQISHGMYGHMERYGQFIEYLTDNGIAVCGNDHLGHGLSATDSGGLGQFSGADGALCLVRDMNSLYLIMRKKYRFLPYIFFGHSLGSFLVRKYITQYPDDADGVILSGTSGKQPLLPLGLFLVGAMKLLCGGKHRNKLIDRFMLKKYNKRFNSSGATGYEWVTKETEVINKFMSDKLCSFTYTLSAYLDILKLLADISSPEWAAAVPQGTPMLLIGGGDDPVGNYGAGVEWVYNELKNAELCSVSIKLYPGDRHELVNESDRLSIYADLLEWIHYVKDGIIACRTGGMPL